MRPVLKPLIDCPRKVLDKIAEAIEGSKSSQKRSYALPAIMAAWMLDAWDAGLEGVGVMASLLYMDLGYHDRSKEYAEGVVSQYTAQSLLNVGR